MSTATQVSTIGSIRIDGQGNSFTINQIVQIAVDEIKNRSLETNSPYLGLRQFQERDKDVFFGRDQLVAQLLQSVAQSSLVLVAGASGSGKSSVVLAGLLPQLHRLLPKGRFHPIVMTPGSNPFDRLRTALMHPGLRLPDAESLVPELCTNSDDGLIQVVTELRAQDDQWLLVVDQFEEIFTLCKDQATRTQFIDGLVRLAQSNQDAVKIVLTMRADFFDRIGAHPTLTALVERGLRVVADMQPSELRAAIEQPAALHGVVFEEGLVDQIIADIRWRPGALPLLQYTLDQLWHSDDLTDRTLNRATYLTLGGVEGALKKRATQIYSFTGRQRKDQRPAEEQEAIRRIFLQLVDIVALGSEIRAVSKRNLKAVFGPKETVILNELLQEKLLTANATTGAGAHNAASTVEIAHEALIGVWDQLRDWIEKAREVLYLGNRLTADARQWDERTKRDPSKAHEELLTGSRLDSAITLRDRGEFDNIGLPLSSLAREYIQASQDARDAAKHKEEQRERTLRELDEQRRLAEDNARQQGELVRQRALDSLVERGRQLLLSGSWHEALPELQRAYQEGSTNPTLPLLLTGARRQAESKLIERDFKGTRTLATQFGPAGPRIVTGAEQDPVKLWSLSDEQPLVLFAGAEGGVTHAALSADGTRILLAFTGQRLGVWSTDLGSCLSTIEVPTPDLRASFLSPDGRWVLTYCDSSKLDIWDAETGQRRSQYAARIAPAQTDPFSPDSTSIAADDNQGGVVFWNFLSGATPRKLSSKREQIRFIAFSGNGKILVTTHGSEGAVDIWEVESGECVRSLTSHSSRVARAILNHDGTSVLLLGYDPTAYVYAVDGRVDQQRLQGHRSWIRAAQFSLDGSRILTASEDGTAIVWEDGELLWVLPGNTKLVDFAHFSIRGTEALIVDREGAATLWNVQPPHLVDVLRDYRTGPIHSPPDDKWGRRHMRRDHRKPAIDSPFGASGRFLLGRNHTDQVGAIWDLTDPAKSVCRLDHTAGLRYAKLSPDSSRLLTATKAEVIISEWPTLRELARLPIAQVGVAEMDWQNSRLLTSGEQPELWSIDPPVRIAELHLETGDKLLAKFCPKQTKLLTLENTSGQVALWDEQTGETLVPSTDSDLLSKPSRSITEKNMARIVFSPDGKRALTTTEHVPTVLWDLEQFQPIAILEGHFEDVEDLGFSPDTGATIVTAGRDGHAHIWNSENGEHLNSLTGHTDALTTAVFSPDGRFVATASEDLSLGIWDPVDGKLLRVLRGHKQIPVGLRFIQQGKQLVSLSQEGAFFWDVEVAADLNPSNVLASKS